MQYYSSRRWVVPMTLSLDELCSFDIAPFVFVFPCQGFKCEVQKIKIILEALNLVSDHYMHPENIFFKCRIYYLTKFVQLKKIFRMTNLNFHNSIF